MDVRRESKTHKHTLANGHKSQRGGASRRLGGCSHAQPSFHFESITLIPEISARIAPTNEYFLFDFSSSMTSEQLRHPGVPSLLFLCAARSAASAAWRRASCRSAGRPRLPSTFDLHSVALSFFIPGFFPASRGFALRLQPCSLRRLDGLVSAESFWGGCGGGS